MARPRKSDPPREARLVFGPAVTGTKKAGRKRVSVAYRSVFARRLSEGLALRGVSREGFAAELGHHDRKTVDRWCSTSAAMPDLETVLVIASRLGLSLDWLLMAGGSPELRPPVATGSLAWPDQVRERLCADMAARRRYKVERLRNRFPHGPALWEIIVSAAVEAYEADRARKRRLKLGLHRTLKDSIANALAFLQAANPAKR